VICSLPLTYLDLLISRLHPSAPFHRDSQNHTDVRQDIVNLLAIVLPAAAHLEISSTRCYKKLNAYTAVAFASLETANWLVYSWDYAARYQYAGMYAVLPNT
jgi:hypothetical protein